MGTVACLCVYPHGLCRIRGCPICGRTAVSATPRLLPSCKVSPLTHTTATSLHMAPELVPADGHLVICRRRSGCGNCPWPTSACRSGRWRLGVPKNDCSASLLCSPCRGGRRRSAQFSSGSRSCRMRAPSCWTSSSARPRAFPCPCRRWGQGFVCVCVYVCVCFRAVEEQCVG